ncbi:MAG: hypothetical protein NVS3B26_19610 [Mycobacteriales bacterium]
MATRPTGALPDMQGRWKNQVAALGWYRKTKEAFAALPEDDRTSWPMASRGGGFGRGHAV